MSLHRTDFSPLDHGTTRKRQPGLLLDLALCVPLLIGIAAAWLYGLAAECWRDVIYWATGRK
jgi:hypothetical protein